MGERCRLSDMVRAKITTARRARRRKALETLIVLIDAGCSTDAMIETEKRPETNSTLRQARAAIARAKGE